MKHSEHAELRRTRRGNPNKCYYCGQEEKCTTDHFYPKKLGGRTRVTACKICQGSKADMMPDKWVEYIMGHTAIRGEIAVRITTAVMSLMEMTRDEYLEIKTKLHEKEWGRFQIKP